MGFPVSIAKILRAAFYRTLWWLLLIEETNDRICSALQLRKATLG